MSNAQPAMLRALKGSLPYFSRTCLKIKTKDATITPLIFNQSQQFFHEICERQLKTKGNVRLIVVKGRQSGISTYVAARFYHKTSMNVATNTFILSHESTTTSKLFDIVKLYQNNNPVAPQSSKSNARELNFGSLDSTYYVGTAGSGDVGRGGTVRLFHGSEVAMWKNTEDIQTGVLESVPNKPGTEIILESTAKGMGNFFHQLTVDALAGKNEYEVVFIPWHWMDEYELDASRFEPTFEEIEYSNLYFKAYDLETQRRKLAWRRSKIATFRSDWKFKQEYPATVQEAFQTSGDSLINPESIVKARQNNILQDDSPLIIGVDPARTGDRTAIVFRRGRKIERIIKYDEMDEMHLAGILAGIIDKYDPKAVNIDCTNSWGTHDRLHERNYKKMVNGIHFSQKAIENRLYRNIRAEMWCNLRDWFETEGGVDIPDDDEFQIDLMSVPDYRETSDGLIKLESKDKIKEAAGFSPDIGDAAALTFAVPINTNARPVKKAEGGGLRTTKRFIKKKGTPIGNNRRRTERSIPFS